jgi:hypothetical protein
LKAIDLSDGLTVGAASQYISGLNQIVSDPRRLIAALQTGQYLVL